MPVHRLITTSTALALFCLVMVSGGCTQTQTTRISHAPTYSYLNDPLARAEVELWPSTAVDESSLASADSPEYAE